VNLEGLYTPGLAPTPRGLSPLELVLWSELRKPGVPQLYDPEVPRDSPLYRRKAEAKDPRAGSSTLLATTKPVGKKLSR
jgi:hypothetical protein